LDRPDSLPGRKDRQELLSLLTVPGSAGAPAVIRAASARTPTELATLVDRAFLSLVGDPSLNRQDRARLRQTAQHWLLVSGRSTTSGAPLDRRMSRALDCSDRRSLAASVPVTTSLGPADHGVACHPDCQPLERKRRGMVAQTSVCDDGSRPHSSLSEVDRSTTGRKRGHWSDYRSYKTQRPRTGEHCLEADWDLAR
jgi:hypothetical protein